MTGDQASAQIPDTGIWPDLNVEERERRDVILRAIRTRIEEDGPRRAVASPNRGRLFMPFAALKGFDEAIDEAGKDL